MRNFSSDGAYINYLSVDNQTAVKASYGKDYDRLMDIKTVRSVELLSPKPEHPLLSNVVGPTEAIVPILEMGPKPRPNSRHLRAFHRIAD